MLATILLMAGLLPIDGNPTPGVPIILDVSQIQPWMVVLGGIASFLGALGLSPAPWLLGLATGKIQFTSQANAAHQRELDARDEAHEKEVSNLKQYHKDVFDTQVQRYADLTAAKDLIDEALEKQTARANTANDALAQAAVAIEAGNHIIAEFTQAAREVSVDGP